MKIVKFKKGALELDELGKLILGLILLLILIVIVGVVIGGEFKDLLDKIKNVFNIFK